MSALSSDGPITFQNGILGHSPDLSDAQATDILVRWLAYDLEQANKRTAELAVQYGKHLSDDITMLDEMNAKMDELIGKLPKRTSVPPRGSQKL